MVANVSSPGVRQMVHGRSHSLPTSATLPSPRKKERRNFSYQWSRFTHGTLERVLRSSRSRQTKEIEVSEACDWLVQTGFPQYVQLFQESLLPINLDLVAEDHSHLDRALLKSVYRRLELLNQCAHMKLDITSKKPHPSECEEEQCALSRQWKFDQGKWNRQQETGVINGSPQGVHTAPSSNGRPRKLSLNSYGEASEDSVLDAGEIDSGGDETSPLFPKKAGPLNISIPHHRRRHQGPDSGNGSVASPLPSSDSSAGSVTVSGASKEQRSSAKGHSALSAKDPRSGSLFRKLSGTLRSSQRKKRAVNASGASGSVGLEIGDPSVTDPAAMSCRVERLGCVELAPWPADASQDCPSLDLVNNNSRRKMSASLPGNKERRPSCTSSEQGAGAYTTEEEEDYLLPAGHVPGTFPLSLTSAMTTKRRPTDKSHGSMSSETSSATGSLGLDDRHPNLAVARLQAMSDSRMSVYDNVPGQGDSLDPDGAGAFPSADAPSAESPDTCASPAAPPSDSSTPPAFWDISRTSVPLRPCVTSGSSGDSKMADCPVEAAETVKDIPSSSVTDRIAPWLIPAPQDGVMCQEIQQLNDVLADLLRSSGLPVDLCPSPEEPFVHSGSQAQTGSGSQERLSSAPDIKGVEDTGRKVKDSGVSPSPCVEDHSQHPQAVVASLSSADKHQDATDEHQDATSTASDSSHHDCEEPLDGEKGGSPDSQVWRARRDSGVGSSLSREGEGKKRLRWHSFVKSHRPSSSATGVGMQLNALSAGQASVLRKLCLLKVTTMMELHASSHKTSWNLSVPKFMRKSKSASSPTGRQVFGVPLQAIQQRWGQPLPLPIQYAMRFLRSHARDNIGLFRRPGSVARVQRLKEDIEKAPEERINFAETSTIQAFDVADLLKLYFRELPECLFTTKLSETFLAIQQHVPAERRLEAFQAALVLLPDENREVLECLLYFLSDMARQSGDTQMPSSNLALVFAPSLFNLFSNSGSNGGGTPSLINTSRSPKIGRRTSPSPALAGMPDPMDLMEQKYGCEVLEQLIDHCKILFTVSSEILSQCRVPDMEEQAPAPLSQLCPDGDYRSHIKSCVQGLLKETTQRFKGWVSVGPLSCPGGDSVEVAHKKIVDVNPLHLWKCTTEVKGTPEVILRRLKSGADRSQWDEDFTRFQTVKELEGVDADIFQYQCSAMAPQPPREYVVLRAWCKNLPRGACALLSNSVDHPCPSMGGIRGTELASRYLIEPVATAPDTCRVTHISRVDMRGRAPAWYTRAYGHIAGANLGRLRALCDQASAPAADGGSPPQKRLHETKV